MKLCYSTASIYPVILFLLALSLTGKEMYEVSGKLVDEDGSAIAGHRVLLLNESDDQIATDQTDSEGRFTLSYQKVPSSAQPGYGSESPSEFKLGSSYPNPFNPRTTVPFEAPVNTNAVIAVYNMLGQEVIRTRAEISKGSHEIVVNLGAGLSQGQYLLRVQGEGYSLTRSMTFISAGVSSGTTGILLRTAGGQIGAVAASQVQPAGEEQVCRLIIEGSDEFEEKELSVPVNQNHDAGEITLTKKDLLVWPRDTETEIVEVTNPETGRTWMDRNLGASRAATSSTDSEAYGDLYQWGRAADGHQKRNSPTASTLSSSDQTGHGDFILSSDSPLDWRSPQNDDLWQGVNGTNNPCPAGYRLPTEAEWNAERNSWSSNDAAGALESPLKLPMAGRRSNSCGSLFIVGTYGFYWSGTVPGIQARSLYFASRFAIMYDFLRAYGYSVRCIKD